MIKLTKNFAMIIVLSLLFIPFIMGQTSGQPSTQETEVVDIIIDDDIIDTEVIIRVPEASIQPRTRTEEIDFTLNYLRLLIVESNKQLY